MNQPIIQQCCQTFAFGTMDQKVNLNSSSLIFHTEEVNILDMCLDKLMMVLIELHNFNVWTDSVYLKLVFFLINDGNSVQSENSAKCASDKIHTHTDEQNFANKWKVFLILIGAYGEVRKCLSKETNALRAVKIINKKYLERTQEEQLLSEISILKQMDHPNILKLYEFFQDPKRYFLVTE